MKNYIICFIAGLVVSCSCFNTYYNYIQKKEIKTLKKYLQESKEHVDFLLDENLNILFKIHSFCKSKQALAKCIETSECTGVHTIKWLFLFSFDSECSF